MAGGVLPLRGGGITLQLDQWDSQARRRGEENGAGVPVSAPAASNRHTGPPPAFLPAVRGLAGNEPGPGAEQASRVDCRA